jgi:hypothetical protein
MSGASHNLLAWAALSAATLAAQVPLPPLAWAAGHQSLARLGRSIETRLDLNGDGRRDVIAAAPGGDSQGPIVLGSVCALLSPQLDQLWKMTGQESDGLYGRGLSATADWNGDGVMEVAIGEPQCEVELQSFVYDGRVRIHSGATGAALYTLDSPQPGARFGTALEGLADLDADGLADLLIGAPRWKNQGQGSGAVRAVRGGSGTVLWTHVHPLAGDQSFGLEVVALGDLDLDGVPEVAAGKNYYTGSVRILSGANGTLLQQINQPAGPTFQDFGWSLLGPGDLDGDGVPDLVVGAPHGGFYPETGRVHVYSGASFQAIGQWHGLGNDIYGLELANAGDFDGDGANDVLVSAPGWVYAPDWTERVELVSGATGKRLRILQPEVPHTDLGWAIGRLDDWNGDGEPEFALGAPDHSGLVKNGGRVEVHSLPKQLVALHAPTTYAAPETYIDVYGAGFETVQSVRTALGPAEIVEQTIDHLRLRLANPNPGASALELVASTGSVLTQSGIKLWPHLAVVWKPGPALLEYTLDVPSKFGFVLFASPALSSIPLPFPGTYHGLLLDLGPGFVEVASARPWSKYTYTVPIPNPTALAGMQLHLQAYVERVAGPAPLASFTNVASVQF